MDCLKRIKEEIAFSIISRREKTGRRLREVSPREKKLYQFRNTLEQPRVIKNRSHQNRLD